MALQCSIATHHLHDLHDNSRHWVAALLPDVKHHVLHQKHLSGQEGPESEGSLLTGSSLKDDSFKKA
eukprot:CAMPEP_0119113708 /NCGR_PEP_ID=MMETSP1180-20130426/44918_1 /TAXON_ID=3052 ORGANISM="Chlamydomonas cf sp, Strain CCMP681" /NCGR_SAMPLE_ID=MMETSP1180 /ASSEMBLY_ACC=CAM_ASM_000741 /LENGTH=66 /DNA_ID=CAMNT_0007101933 /DNA_START=463 /DNA_END=661 /DNA_ORIENTATION=+